MEPTAAFPTDLWCCARPVPYKARRTDHDDKFAAFLTWSRSGAPTQLRADFVVQFVKSVNFGLVVSKRCFLFDRTSGSFREVESRTMRSLNSFKNYRCATCDGSGYFYELNLYHDEASGTSAVSSHHQSTRTGSEFVRDAAAIDMQRGVDKGDHWK